MPEPYNKKETRKAKKTNNRSAKPVTIHESQMKKHKSEGVITGEE
ncbi:hypothetical protein [Hathewaya limosa]|uniref:Uncharacterized protein n=1 Tax=Hathewaya limosa TaxID=1536 RepID=A0ABU0JQ22_HATLI|nr:hypothetical protein [Hathewaya limosa]MDQ0479191.1 hypothetical protein [Hathewaya limosa]